MTTLHRRALLLSALAVVGAACAPAETAGLRGMGTVLHPAAEPLPTRPPEPTAGPTPAPATPVPTSAPAVRTEDLPRPASALGTDAEAHVLPVPAAPPAGMQPFPARRLVIPTLGLDSKVIQLNTRFDRHGVLAWETAPFAVGHHRGTAGPGQKGNMVLSGHISSPGEGAVFHRLPEVKVGEGIIVATDERQYLYRVVDTRVVTPEEVSVMSPTADATATLLTCVPDHIYSHRLVVTARLV